MLRQIAAMAVALVWGMASLPAELPAQQLCRLPPVDTATPFEAAGSAGYRDTVNWTDNDRYFSGDSPPVPSATLVANRLSPDNGDVNFLQTQEANWLDRLFPLADSGHHVTGFMDLNYYYDTRHTTVFTANLGAKLPHDFEFFQLLNLTGSFGDGSDSTDWTGYYTELNLRRPIAKENDYLKHLDWTVQFADGSQGSDVLRLGVRWRLQDTPGALGGFVKDTLKLNYSINLHAIEFDGSGWQLEHVFRREFLNKRVYVCGFCDHNINNQGSQSTWVTETQIGVKLTPQIYAVAEYRYIDFAPPGFRSGWGFGLEYVIRFK